MRKPLPKGRELWDYARKLGVSFGALPFRTDPGENPDLADKENEYEIQRRVVEVEKHHREHVLALVAIIAAVASVLSAVTAFYAVVHRLK
jgi:hypothetical protein